MIPITGLVHTCRPNSPFLQIAIVVLVLAGLVVFDTDVLDSNRPSGEIAANAGRSDSFSFYSRALDRPMPLTVFVPPGYDAGSERYPVLYMLHGLGGARDEWQEYGTFDIARELMRTGEVPPFIIVLPEGEDGYWFDHANGGARWGQYLAKDVVNVVDARYRTQTQREFRAIGGLSMGADGALQIAMNNPSVFGVVQAHGPVLRPYELAAPYFGEIAYFEAHYPVTLVQSKPDVARTLRIELDVGDVDLWLEVATAFHEQLNALSIPHQWHVWPGGHDREYWVNHIPDGLRMFGAALGSTLTKSP